MLKEHVKNKIQCMNQYINMVYRIIRVSVFVVFPFLLFHVSNLFCLLFILLCALYTYVYLYVCISVLILFLQTHNVIEDNVTITSLIIMPFIIHALLHCPFQRKCKVLNLLLLTYIFSVVLLLEFQR